MQHQAAAEPAQLTYLEGDAWQKSRSYSPAIITTGGRLIWLAGQTTVTDLDGNDISGRFDAQARTIFTLMERTLARAGGSLANLVTMTVFINDPRHGAEFVEIRREFFAEGRFPCSALLTISNFSRPGSVIEIQGVAAI